jgi:hypothetical protein
MGKSRPDQCTVERERDSILSIIDLMEVLMKSAKLTVLFMACAAAIPAVAQNAPDSRCGKTNFDRSRSMFTIVHPIPGVVNQQCFVTVVPKQSWGGGMPDLSSSELVEGNYEITLSGGGGGGGAGAVPVTTVRYLQPGMYRLTIGAGGLGGTPNGGSGKDGAPTSLSNANTGETFAGFAGAETWNGIYSNAYNVAAIHSVSDQYRRDASAGGYGGPAFVPGQSSGGRGGRVGLEPRGEDGGKLVAVAYSGEPGRGGTDLAGHRLRHEVGGGGGGGAGFGNGGSGESAVEDGKVKTGAKSGDAGAGGGGGAGGEGVADSGAPGGNGFIRIVLTDPPPQAQIQRTEPAPAPVDVTPAYVPPPPPEAPVRPAKTDRN